MPGALAGAYKKGEKGMNESKTMMVFAPFRRGEDENEAYYSLEDRNYGMLEVSEVTITSHSGAVVSVDGRQAPTWLENQPYAIGYDARGVYYFPRLK